MNSAKNVNIIMFMYAILIFSIAFESNILIRHKMVALYYIIGFTLAIRAVSRRLCYNSLGLIT